MTEKREMVGRAVPWYSHPEPWFLMLGPFVVVVASFVTLWLAIRSNDGLVADDYYKQGLAINRTIAQGHLAEALQIKAQLHLESGQIRLSLHQREGTAMPHRLHLKFSNEARSGFDQTVDLDRTESEFRGVKPSLPQGLWSILLEDEDRTWRLLTVARIPQDAEINFGAVDSRPLN